MAGMNRKVRKLWIKFDEEFGACTIVYAAKLLSNVGRNFFAVGVQYAACTANQPYLRSVQTLKPGYQLFGKGFAGLRPQEAATDTAVLFN